MKVARHKGKNDHSISSQAQNYLIIILICIIKEADVNTEVSMKKLLLVEVLLLWLLLFTGLSLGQNHVVSAPTSNHELNKPA